MEMNGIVKKCIVIYTFGLTGLESICDIFLILYNLLKKDKINKRLF